MSSIATVAVMRHGAWSLPIGDADLVSDKLVANEVGTELEPFVTELANGGWVVAWSVQDGGAGDGADTEILQQRYAADGSKIGGLEKVDASDAEEDTQVSVAALNDGGWVVVWRSQGDWEMATTTKSHNSATTSMATVLAATNK